MRRYDIPYVRRGPATYSIPKPIEELSREELIQKFVRTCAKAKGNVRYCSEQCKSQCEQGKRAVEMTENIPLYGGKTLLEKAREENAKRREAEKKKKYIKWDGWWEESLASGDQVKWIMANMGLDRDRAKKKIYQYRYLHDKKTENAPVDTNLETRLAKLLEEQKKYEKEMNDYQKQYESAKYHFEETRTKVDILRNAKIILSNS